MAVGRFNTTKFALNSKFYICYWLGARGDLHATENGKNVGDNRMHRIMSTNHGNGGISRSGMRLGTEPETVRGNRARITRPKAEYVFIRLARVGVRGCVHVCVCSCKCFESRRRKPRSQYNVVGSLKEMKHTVFFSLFCQHEKLVSKS